MTDPIESDKVEWTDGVLTIKQSGLTVSMKKGAAVPTAHRIVVVGSRDSSTPLELTINGLGIETGEGPVSPVSVSGDVKIILQGSNTLTAERFYYDEEEKTDDAAGLQQTGVTVTINSKAYPDEEDKIATAEGGHLIIACGKAADDANHVCAESDTGCGRLTAEGKWNGAGIGAGIGSDAHVTIQGGIIEKAEGGNEGAGIGGGSYKDGVVRITGGTIVNATTNSLGAGIGGDDHDGYVIITDGTIVEAQGGGEGAGIGGADCGDGYVIIGGDAVIKEAIGSNYAAEPARVLILTENKLLVDVAA